MKILFVTEFFPSDDLLQFTGGVEAYNFYLLRELAKKQQVTVICRWGKSQSIQKKNWGMKIIRVGKKQKRIDTNLSTIPGRLMFFFQSLYQGLNLEFDLVQGNNFVSYPSAFLIGFIKRKPRVIWCADVLIGHWISLTGVVSGLAGEIVERLSLILPWNYVVSLSKSTTQKLLKQNIDSKNITTIYGGVDFDYFSKVTTKKEKVFTICCIARMVSYKRIDLLIKAAAILDKRKVDFKIEIIGDGPEDFSLKLLVHKLNMQPKISFKSNISREDLAKILKSSHLFCLSSEQEGFGLVVMEAASCRLPYVVSDIDVFKEITNNGQGGLFFKKGDSRDLANKLNRIIKDKKLYRKLSEDAYNLAKQYHWKKISSQFEGVYNRVLQKPKTILMLLDAWFPHVGGGQIHAWELVKQLAKNGYGVTIFTRDLGIWNETFEGTKVVRIGHFKKFSNFAGRVEYLLRALFYSLTADYDIWHAHAFSPGLLAPIVKFFRQKPIIFTAHGEGMKIAGLNINGNFLQDLVFYKIPYDAEITVARKTFTKKTKSKKLVVIPNGVNINDWIPAQRKRKKLIHLLYVGRIVYDKGVDLLIDAYKKMKGFDLTIVGEGPEVAKLKNLARKYKINFTGKLEGEDLINQFKKADLLAMPSRVEGMPLRLLEAWSAKLPVVATKVGDNEVYIKDGVNGFLTDTTSDSIFQGIERARKTNLRVVAQNGWKDVQKFSWENIARKTIKVYEEVLNEKT